MYGLNLIHVFNCWVLNLQKEHFGLSLQRLIMNRRVETEREGEREGERERRREI